MHSQELTATHTRDRGLLARFGARHYLASLGFGLLIAAALLPVGNEEPGPRPLGRMAESLLADSPRTELPLALAELAAQTVPELTWHTAIIKSGESLASIFKKNGLNPQDLHQIMQVPGAADTLRKILPGKQIAYSLDAAGVLRGIKYERDAVNSLVVTRSDEGFEAKHEAKPVVTTRKIARGTIKGSLFASAAAAGLTNQQVFELANIFGYDIDFAQDLRVGDTFELVFEERTVEGQAIEPGPIRAAVFVNDGQTFTAVRYVDRNNVASYYSKDGKSLRKAFMRAPLQFSRISSDFNPSRRHPILNTIRAHKGTDYAAPGGTPVYAAGDGKVIFVGTRGGYGRVVYVQHGSGVETRYAHLSRYGKGLHVGSRVNQGEIIGYVGASGLASAPHLHYEFLVNGVHRNPRTVPLPTAEPIPQKERDRFYAQIGDDLRLLEAGDRRRTAVAP